MQPDYIATDDNNTGETIDDELAELSPDLSTSMIHSLIRNVYSPYVSNFTKFGAPNCKGTELYQRMTESLRDCLSSCGWETLDTFEVPCIVSRRDGIRLVCAASGGPSTGIDYPAKPVVKKRGTGTLRLAGRQKYQMDVIPGMADLSEQEDKTSGIDDLDFYYLLMYLDEKHEEIRVEVSSPVFDKCGNLIEWSRRIILPPVDLAPAPSVAPDEVTIPEVKVVPKNATA